MKRIFLIVLDSVGAGAAPDAAHFGDEGAHTLKSLASSSKLNLITLAQMGIGNIDGLSFLGKVEAPIASFGRMVEKSAGKDTTIGHWEIAGIVSKKAMPTYPNGFSDCILKEFSEKTGRGVLCNRPYSGTDAIRDYGDNHVKSGDLIVYTSADSVFQIAAHEDVVPVEMLYEYCKIARTILKDDNAVGRVIARPFIGSSGNYKRTENRRDFSVEPPRPTMLNFLCDNKYDVIGIGKISDIFVGSGITDSIHTHNNREGMDALLKLQDKTFCGLCFANLVDFDMLYGHRNDIDGYAAALTEFDEWLPEFIYKMNEDDLLIVTADHGCDPGFSSTDHTREDVPLIVYSKKCKCVNLGIRDTFADVSKTVCDIFDVENDCAGKSFAKEIGL